MSRNSLIDVLKTPPSPQGMPDSSSDPPSPPDKDPLDPLARLTVWLDRHHRSLSKVLYAGAAVGAVVIVASVRGVRERQDCQARSSVVVVVISSLHSSRVSLVLFPHPRICSLVPSA